MKACQQCGSSAIVKNGKYPSGSQRFKCRACGQVTTPQPNRNGYDDHTRTTALRLTLEGNSFASAGRVLEINPQTVANWVKIHVDSLPEQPAKPRGEPEQVEVDELFTFIGSKKTGPTSSRQSSGRHAVS